MKKVKKIHQKKQEQLFNGVQKQLNELQKLTYYRELAVDDDNEEMRVQELIRQHLYFFYLRHLCEEKVKIAETLNDKTKKIEIKYGISTE